MIPVVTHGSDQSANNPEMALMPTYVRHEYLINARGELEHHIGGRLRATVPPEGWEAYAESWPDSRLVTKPATGKKAAIDTRAPAPIATKAPAKSKRK